MSDVRAYFDDFFSRITSEVNTDFKHIAIGVIFAIVLYFLYQMLDKTLNKKVDIAPVDINIKKIIHIVIRWAYIFFSVMIVASFVGIDTSSLIAAFSVLGIAISLSIQQIMGNVANAFAIFINKPFKIDDHVKVNDMEGIIKDISFVNTKIKTYDNEIIIIPNNIIGNAIIYNYSLNDIRRIVLEISVPYKFNSELVKKTILVALNDKNIIKDNGIIVAISRIENGAVVYIARFYSSEANYTETKERALENIKKEFECNEIEIYSPVRIVEMKNKTKSVGE